MEVVGVVGLLACKYLLHPPAGNSTPMFIQKNLWLFQKNTHPPLLFFSRKTAFPIVHAELRVIVSSSSSNSNSNGSSNSSSSRLLLGRSPFNEITLKFFSFLCHMSQLKE